MSVREPDEATIAAGFEVALKLADDASASMAESRQLVAAIDAMHRLVEDRNTERSGGWTLATELADEMKRADAAEAEVAVLTARLEPMHEALEAVIESGGYGAARRVALTALGRRDR